MNPWTTTHSTRPPPFRRGAARIYGIALIAAPLLLLLLASTVAYIVEGEGINHGMLGCTIGGWSCLALTIGFVASCGCWSAALRGPRRS